MEPLVSKMQVLQYPMDGDGKLTIDVQPGDFILIKGSEPFDKLIKFGQSLRFHGTDSKYADYTHVALIVSDMGDLIESDHPKVIQSTISKYKDFDFILVKTNASLEDRGEIVAFARACLNEEYGWATIVSVALSFLTGLKFSFGFDGQEICSGLVARALERKNEIYPHDAAHITPADLAKLYLS